MSKNIPSLISWDALKEKLIPKQLVKTAAKKEKDSDHDDKGDKKVVVDAGGREFGPRKGLEGPFKTKGGGHKGVYYYDPKEGKYYCPYTDMYLEGSPSNDFSDSTKKASLNLEQEAAKLGKNLASWATDGNTPEATYKFILKGYDDGDPRVMDLYDKMLSQDGSMKSFIEEHLSDADDDTIQNVEFAHQEAFWDELIRVCKFHANDNNDKIANQVYEIIYKDSFRNVKFNTFASNFNEAIENSKKYASKNNLNWISAEIEIKKNIKNTSEFNKKSQNNPEDMSLAEMTLKMVKHLMQDQPGQHAIYIGQIEKLVDLMNDKTGSSYSSEDVLNALAEAASSQKADIEIGGSPEEAYLILNEEKTTSASSENFDKTAKKKSKKKKNKPTNPGLWARALSAAKAKFDVYPCVPLDSLAITKTGPQIYENLKIGDEILSYNIEKDELEWNSILNMHYFENAPMVQIGKATGFQVKCTPNHKWVVRRGENYQNIELIETKDLNKHMQLVVCASLENSSELVMEKWSKKDSWIEKILSMSKNEREIFLASAIIYDGHDKGVSTKILNRHSFGFSQKNEDHFYATILAAYLNGYHVTFADKYPDMQSATIIRNKKTHNTQNLIMKNVESEDVWCPETANGTWVMIQNGFLTITGNSAYANGYAVQWYKKRGGGWRKS